MFRVRPTKSGKAYRMAIVGLLTLSATALGVTLWIMVDFLREQEIVQSLIGQLPPQARADARELAGELRWQFRLTILVVLNLVVTVCVVLLLWRAYRASQESLRDIKALAGDILSSMEQAVITTDIDGVVTSINQRGIELLKLDGEFVGRQLADLSEQLQLESFRRAVRSGEIPESTRDFPVTASGAIRYLRLFCQPLRDYQDADIGNVIQIRDVTERTLIDERLRRMERYMGLGSLAAGLHHEIKNPLAALSLHVQLLEEEITAAEASDDVQQMLNVIKTEVKRIGGVLESFRDFASVDQLNMSEVDVKDLIAQQVALITPQATARHVTVRTQFADSLPTVHADRIRLEQVLLNLLVNGMEAMQDSGELSVQAVRAGDGSEVRIEVTDPGSGIPKNIQDRVLDPYFTTKNGGTGMGLALCDKIVRQHAGTLDFQSSESETTFGFTIPIA